MEVERWGPSHASKEKMCHTGAGGRLAPSGGCRFGWLGRRVVLFGGEGGICPAVRAQCAQKMVREPAWSRQRNQAGFPWGGGSPLLFVVGLLRCENGGIAAALLGAVAETAGIRSGGGRGLRKGKKGGVSLLSCWMIVEYIYVQYEYIIHTYKNTYMTCMYVHT